MKKLRVVSLVLIFAVIMSVSMPMAAQDNVTVYYDGEQIVFDVNPMIIQGRTLVPMRKIFETFGASVFYDANTKTITAEKESAKDGSRKIILKIGDAKATVIHNGVTKQYTLDTAAIVMQGRTLVPLRFVGEALGTQVNWDGLTKTVSIFNISFTNNNIQKVLVLNIDPILRARNNIKLHQLCDWWSDPKTLSKEYISDFKEFTKGFITYEIVEWIELNEFPYTIDGFIYDDISYVETFNKAYSENGAYWSSNAWKPKKPLDYNYYIERYDLVQRVQNKEIDEVWMFSGPFTGEDAFESIMVGKNAYFCNGPEIEKDCKPFVIYFFNYERDVGCMLENAGHRMESIMRKVFGRWDYSTPYEEMNKWERFTLYDKVSPGNAGCGNVHFAPNSDSDYDWGNTRKVWTSYNSWLNYPDMSFSKVFADCSAWGYGDMRLHHKWWFNCIPCAPGIDENGYLSNWWIYFISPTIMIP